MKKLVIASLLVACGSSAVGQIVVPREFTTAEAPADLNTLIRDSGQPRTYQMRWREPDLAPRPTVYPPAQAGAIGNVDLNTLVRNAGNARTYQMRISAADLAGIPVGAPLDRIAYRINEGPATWPGAGGVRWANYEITLSQDANPGGSLTTTFAANQLNPVLVRRGELVIPEGVYEGGTAATVQPFGRDIYFQRPYVYQGGNLIITITHDGSNEVATAPFLDAQTVAAGNVVTQTTFRAVSGNATTTFTVIRLGMQSVTAGKEIANVRWRLSGGQATWPLTVPTWADYEMYLSEDAAGGAALSTTFANNEARTVQVRDGQLQFPVNAFTGGATPNTFGGPSGVFFTNGRNYIYPGGSLIFRATHTGSDLTGVNSTRFLDAVSVAGDSLSSTTFGAATGVVSASTITEVGVCDDGTTIVPLQNSNAGGTGIFNTLVRDVSRTYQCQWANGQMIGLNPGDIITEIQLRAAITTTASTWPPADVTFSDYEITLSEAANTVGTFSLSVPGNQLNPKLVRSGPLTIPANSINVPATGGLGTFDLRIPVAAYQYRGGALVMTVTHSGGGVTPIFLDGQANGAAFVGQGVGGFRATTLNTSTAPFAGVVRFKARAPEAANVLYTNGRLVNRPFAAPTGDDYILQGGSILGFNFNRATNFALADDFAVAYPYGWRMTGAEIYGYTTGSAPGTSPFTGVNVQVWSGVPHASGSSLMGTTSVITSDEFNGSYSGTVVNTQRPTRRINMTFASPLILPPGQYWLAMTGTVSAGTAFMPPLSDDCVRVIPGNALQAANLTGPFNTTSPAQELPFKVKGSLNCTVDLNFDGGVDFNDYLEFLNLFNTGNPKVDYNADGGIDFNDYLEFLNLFNSGC